MQTISSPTSQFLTVNYDRTFIYDEHFSNSLTIFFLSKQEKQRQII